MESPQSGTIQPGIAADQHRKGSAKPELLFRESGTFACQSTNDQPTDQPVTITNHQLHCIMPPMF
jgi:hypothetical protein